MVLPPWGPARAWPESPAWRRRSDGASASPPPSQTLLQPFNVHLFILTQKHLNFLAFNPA